MRKYGAVYFYENILKQQINTKPSVKNPFLFLELMQIQRDFELFSHYMPSITQELLKLAVIEKTKIVYGHQTVWY